MTIKIWTKDEIKLDQDGIRKSVIALDQSIHNNAVQCLLHAEKHGDTSLMTRLLVNIIDAKTGYRRQGLINWVRKFSPMELKGLVMDLSGTMTQEGIRALVRQFPDTKPEVFGQPGAKRPFLVELANATPFWTDNDNAERVAKPVYQSVLFAKLDSFYKEAMAAAENTVNGKAVDPSKPFYDGIHMDALVKIAEGVKAMRDAAPVDNTLEVRRAQAKQRELGDFIEANKANVNDPDAEPAKNVKAAA